MKDISRSRERFVEQQRISSLISMMRGRGSVLDVGARDGYISRLLVPVFDRVVALDLERPTFSEADIETVKGDVTQLDFDDGEFDTVVCAEVLEHIPSEKLAMACRELVRVAKQFVFVGVPYRQDTRAGRTTCTSCGRKNPPWGHVNEFDEQRLFGLFKPAVVSEVAFIGENRTRTNWLSAWLMDLAGNPFGTYGQEEPCIHCGARLQAPSKRSFLSRGISRVAVDVRRMQSPFVRPHANWIHVLFEKDI